MKPQSFVLYASTTPPQRAKLDTRFLPVWRGRRVVGHLWIRIVASSHDYTEAIDQAARPRRGETLLNAIPNRNP